MGVNGKSVLSGITIITLLMGCSATPVNIASLKKPARATQLQAYDVFVGTWNWEATMENASDSGKEWHGTAEWHWSLDHRALAGTIKAASGSTEYEATGIWSWHPTRKRYVWWMFNDWGYPQQGHASYDEVDRRWRMDYVSVGLDGTTSYGRHVITITDSNTLDWKLNEWADPLHLVPKLVMTGVYKRQR